MKPDNTAPRAILELVRNVQELEERAAQQYRPVLDSILRGGHRDAQHIENTLDVLLDFCGHAPVELMYRQLCRYYWQIDQAAAAYYIKTYRERWDTSDPVPDPL